MPRSPRPPLPVPAGSPSRAVAAFVDRVAQTPRHTPGPGAPLAAASPGGGLPAQAVGGQGPARLIFALDATQSRSGTWDLACAHQSAMFEEAAALGGLAVQLVYYRGAGQCRAGPWVTDPRRLLDVMTGVQCRAGRTQIGRVLDHALAEQAKAPLQAVILIGDSMEEDLPPLADRAARLGLWGVPLFVFHEGRDRAAAHHLTHLARLSGGVCLDFDAASPQALRRLLGAVAVYASGGWSALTALAGRGDPPAQRLIAHLGAQDRPTGRGA